MNNIPKKLKNELENDPFYSSCALRGINECGGRITWEHALIYAGKQVQKKFAIVPLCAKHHSVDEYQDMPTMNKELNVWVALNLAQDHELVAISKAIPYLRERTRLNAKYGVWKAPVVPNLTNKP